MIPTGEIIVLEKKKPSAIASITDISRSGRGSNPGLRGQKLAINGLNHNMAFKMWEVHLKMSLHHEEVHLKMSLHHEDVPKSCGTALHALDLQIS